MSLSELTLKYLILLLFASYLILGFASLAMANIGSAFNEREEYKNATKLGNPDDANQFLDRNADSSSLQQLKDSSLVEQGQSHLRSSEYGQFLQESEESKIEAINRFKINPENSMLKNSLAIEQNPMSKTGGRGLSVSETVSKTGEKKSCIEGVDFNVDVGLELILDVEEEEYLGPVQRELRRINIPGDTVHQTACHLCYSIKWKKGRFGLHVHQDSASWREYLCNYLNIPIERIDEQIGFPCGGRGIGDTHWVGKKLATFDAYPFDYTYRFQEKLKRLKEKAEYWQVATEGTEKLAESNQCYETSRICLKSGVKTFLGKYDISRPCWYEKISYRCQSEPRDGCSHLIKRDCQLQDSTYEYKIGSLCLKWKRDFICGGVKRQQHYSIADSGIYCLGGNCHTPTIEENQDFSNVAYLAAVNEANKDCVKEPNGLCKEPITVFPGQVDGCDKIILSFINCCSSMKGWGRDINLCRCSSGEKALALKREKKLCHMVGTYCSKQDPVLKNCVVKKTNFCCFSSKLSRIFQEQARKQLNIGWGSEKTPNCRPLTLKEITQLDFSKFDFEELFDELLTKGKGNINKSFPSLKGGEIPKMQQDHMQGKAGAAK